MEEILRAIYKKREEQSNTIGFMVIDKGPNIFPETDTFDSIFLMIVKNSNERVRIEHYSTKDKKAAVHIVTADQLSEWILLGSNKKIFDWLHQGKILFERNHYITNLKQDLMDFPFDGRKLKIGIEFAKLIRRYTDGKGFFDEGHYLDAYNHVIHSLHHLARLAIIENGYHPEVTVWSQVKEIDPEIYKLYEELICSEEPMDKRLELLFLAGEFLIHSRMEIGVAHLFSVIEEQETWTINEMIQHPKLQAYNVDLSILLEYLIEKGLVEEVLYVVKEQAIYHRCYRWSKTFS